MALSFTRAPTVEVDEEITSTQLKNLSRALSDRLRAFSTCVYRLVWYHMGLWRQIRNPAEPGYVFPSQAEFFDLYQHLDPEYHQGTTWPVTGPGEFEGANVANPMMQFVFGVAPDLDSEDIRINETLPFTPAGDTLEDYWDLGKRQRGAFDPDTGAQNVPAFSAAQDVFKIVQPYYSNYGKSYGGFFPTPIELLSDCGTTENTGLGIPSYEIKFTGLRSDVDVTGLHGTITYDGDGIPTVTYAGSCPCWSDSSDSGHVLGILPLPFAYYVLVSTAPADCTGTFDRLPVSDWIEGPYSGAGVLQKGQGNQLPRALNAFASDFKGTPESRNPDDFDIEEIGFAFQEFMTRQYALAPALGVMVGETIFADYPRFELSGRNYISAGTYLSGEHTFKDGFVFGAAFAKATNLAEVTFLDFEDGDGTVLGSVTLTPDSSGTAMAIWTAEDYGVTPSRLRVKVRTNTQMKSGGTISVEAAELYEYPPNWWDYYLVLRSMASAGGDQFGSGIDGRGADCTFANEIADDLFQHAALVNRYGVAGVRDIAEWVNDNPVYDAQRRFTRDQVRIIRKENFVDYEVANGVSILRFKRFAYGMNNLRADMFKDIAPPIDPVLANDLIEGETYIVRETNGWIIYEQTKYTNNQTFVATTKKEYETKGDALVYVKDGIRHTALKKGFTNEAVMMMQTHCYHPSATSLWKDEAYASYFWSNDRCHFHSGTAAVSSSALLRHFNVNYGISLDSAENYTPTLANERIQFLELFDPHRKRSSSFRWRHFVHNGFPYVQMS